MLFVCLLLNLGLKASGSRLNVFHRWFGMTSGSFLTCGAGFWNVSSCKWVEQSWLWIDNSFVYGSIHNNLEVILFIVAYTRILKSFVHNNVHNNLEVFCL